MAGISAGEMLGRLEKGRPVAALLLLGDEPYLRDACRAQLIEKFVPEAARTWAVSRYSAERGETRQALQQAQTMPMLCPRQVVFLEEVEALEKLGDKQRDAVMAEFEEYFSNPAPFTTLVLEAAGLDQRMKLAKVLTEKALVVAVSLGENQEEREAAAVGLAHSMAQERGVRFEKGAAEDLAEMVAADLMRLKTEIDKLGAYAAEKKLVSREDVAALVISEKTTTVWDLANLIAAKKGGQALEFLERLLREGEEPIRMLGALAWAYRKIVEASEVRAANGYQAARALGMNPAQAEIALQSARKMSRGQLLGGLGALQRADDKLKGGGDPRTIMEFLVAELAGSHSFRAVGKSG